jgi:hypothetical protein
MSLNLIRRLIKGSPLTAVEHDGNLDKLEDAIEAREATGAATAAVAGHVAAADPHSQYLTSAEGNAAYATAEQGTLAATAVQPGGLAAVATSGAYNDLSGRPTIPAAASATPQPLGTAATGNGTNFARDNHVHAMPSAANVGADPSGTAASAVSAHVAAADPHPGYALESAQGTAAALDHGTAAGNLVRLDPTTGRLPAVDGSQLTNLPGGGGGGGVTAVTGSAPITSTGGATPAIGISAATTSAAGSMSAADKTKLDGIAAGAEVNAATDISYDAASREVRSSTGADATLPLVASSAAGLAPASGGGTINFLRADGTWAAPAGGGGTSFAGYAVDNYIVPTAGALGAGQILANANQIALMAFTVERAITTSELAVRVTTAGAGVDFQLAIYGSASGLHSGTPIISTNDLSGGTAGLVQATVTATTFQPGVLYWQAVNTSGTLTFLSVAANNSYHSSIIGSPTLSEALASAGTTFHCRIITSQTFGTWPDLTGVSSVVPNSSQRRVPVFAFLISALP